MGMFRRLLTLLFGPSRSIAAQELSDRKSSQNANRKSSQNANASDDPEFVVLPGDSQNRSTASNQQSQANASTTSNRRQLPKPIDAGQFAPLDRDEVFSKAKKLRWSWGGWFGRRDVIPPVSDQRTALIDKAMVGQGLITPEELVEIHEIGDEMLAVRPELYGAHALAQQAVQQSREERERIKQEKKREAAERKRLRAEQVAHRKATEIDYLGRGVLFRTCG